ncbi:MULTISPECIES: SPOR domain-containing protein [Pseudomonas]|uniref:SPOR domain-containing protein n=1 Tax=Pseudomonas donghuensis TaxID=1163398 RepID=A0AAP0SCV7_9PSED|nr:MULTISPECIES: SPOR domain-containing protein [Pseudomonas]MDF9894604.1 DedD protein [Pseudomonas vranovensis]KDN98130.1 SPOR domain-containing protein [Pseudomonas donghuensis]MBS7597068.1 SPOR domain-containing protein [Pseudomonas sp. RC2C2]MCP6694521.1 SPOR domain-containing protein [Pseudomonas donghuensis]MCP6699990.1 SPOR domain-containing protein [Pseudomonas donghuensis]
MALLDKVVKQRMVGALVLVALAVIFLPMLFSREDEMRQVRVEAPEAPAAPTLPQVQVEPVQVPEPQVLPEEPVIVEQSAAPAQAPSAPIAPVPSATPAPTPAPAVPAVAAKPAEPAPAKAPAKPAATVATAPKPAAGKIDANGLPVSWSIQMASLSNRASADNLQKTLRSQGYNAYIRSAEGMNRVYVGPLIERAEAERLRDVINRQQKLKGFVVRFQPERS